MRMAGPAYILRAASGNRRTSLLRISTSYPVHSRAFHASQTTLKKKGKAEESDTFFDDDGGSDADELFSAATRDPKSQTGPSMPSKPEPLPRGRVSPSSETALVDEKAAEELRLREEQRRDTFQSNYEYLYERTGDAGKQTSALPGRRALRTLVMLANSQEEWQRVIGTFKQWRRYPARPVPSSIQEIFIKRATSTGHAPLVVNILTHHPIYGIDISYPSLARALLKNLITPVNAPPPSEVDPSTHRERLDQALRLSQVFSISTVPSSRVFFTSTVPPSTLPPLSGPPAPTEATTLSPSTDIVLGSLLLSALLRVASLPPSESTAKPDTTGSGPSVTFEPTAVAHAAHDLLVSLRAYTEAAYYPSFDEKGKELLWCISAFTECMVLLSAKRVRQLFDGIHEEVVTVDGTGGETVERMSPDQMISWLRKTRGWLMEDGFELGAGMRRKMEAVMAKEVPAEEQDQTKDSREVGNDVVGAI